MAQGQGFITFYGLAGVRFGEGAFCQLLQAFGGPEQRGRAVGPSRIRIVNGPEFRSQFFPRFSQVAFLVVQFEIGNIRLGGGIAFFRGRQRTVTGIIATDNQQTERQQKGQRRREPPDQGFVRLFMLLTFSGHCFFPFPERVRCCPSVFRHRREPGLVMLSAARRQYLRACRPAATWAKPAVEKLLQILCQ